MFPRRWLGLVLVATTPLGAGCATLLVETAEPLTPAEAIVVLGNRPPADANGRVLPETARRVRHGVRLFRRGLAPRMVMTGGPAPHGLVEADVMKDLAVRLGVAPEAIATERASRSTVENARLTVEMLCAGLDGGCSPRVIVVSSPYHLGRARWLFECAGAQVQVSGTEIPYDRTYRAIFVIREHLVHFAYAFFDPCRLARP